jgi:hypothetical protein
MTNKRSDQLLPALGTLGACAVIFGLSVFGKNHFGPLDGLCNGAAQVAPGSQSTGEVANCGLDTTLYSIASFAFWAAIAIGVLSGVIVLISLLASQETLSAMGAQSGTTTTPRSPTRTTRTTATSGTTPARSVVRAVTRCPKCNAPNDVVTPDGPCYVCGASLAG